MSAFAGLDLSTEAGRALVAVWDALVDENGNEIDAPCTMAPELWFPGKGDPGEFAKDVCTSLCPATEECAVYALLAGETSGVWGGRSANSIRRGTATRRGRFRGKRPPKREPDAA